MIVLVWLNICLVKFVVVARLRGVIEFTATVDDRYRWPHASVRLPVELKGKMNGLSKGWTISKQTCGDVRDSVPLCAAQSALCGGEECLYLFLFFLFLQMTSQTSPPTNPHHYLDTRQRQSRRRLLLLLLVRQLVLVQFFFCLILSLY